MGQSIIGFLISFAFLMVGVTVHEFAHGWVAYQRGDPTAKYSGRLSLNPLVHIDPIMTFMFPLLLFISTGGRFVFGAAKPVPVDFSRLKNPRQDTILVGLAGPAANFLLAVLLSVGLRFFHSTGLGQEILEGLITVNVVLGVFNLIPVPPLDGSRVVMGLLPLRAAYFYAQLDRFGFIIIIVLLSLGVLNMMILPAIDAILKLLIGIP